MPALKIATAGETAMTEEWVMRAGLDAAKFRIGQHEMLALRLTIPHKDKH